MAKIKVIGIQEMLDVNNEELKDFVLRREMKQIRNDDFVSFGNWGGTAGQIKSWILDTERNTENSVDKEDKEYFQIREQRFKWSSKEKAEECLSFFSLYFYNKTMREPTEEENYKAIGLMEKYFEEHKDRIFPPMTLFKFDVETIMEKNKFENTLRQGIIKMFENIERQELYMVERESKKAF